MKETKINFLANACGGKLLGEDSIIKNVVIDSRAACEGTLFVCIVGEKNDGHNYWKKAYDLGCRAFLMSNEDAANDASQVASVILTDDTEKAFAAMAKAYLGQFNIIKVGVTGSVGKTTTKMLTAAVLSKKYNTICTQKNLNTQLGLCLTIFLIDDTTQAAVFEMGMDKPGEIDGYCDLVRPDAAVITMIGVSHLERLGSRSAICDAKLEITHYLQPEAPLFYNEDDEFLYKEEIVRRTNGNFDCHPVLGPSGAFTVSNAESLGTEGIKFTLGANGEICDINIPMLGLHNAENAALACAVGLHYGVSLSEAADALSKVTPTEGRLNAAEIGGVYLIDDAYNAAPDSMVSALETLAGIKAQRRIAVLADMLELGADEEPGHERVGKKAAELGIDYLILVGEKRNLYLRGLVEGGYKSDKFKVFQTMEIARAFVLHNIKPGDAVLIKGSNSTRISEVAKAIKKEFE